MRYRIVRFLLLTLCLTLPPVSLYADFPVLAIGEQPPLFSPAGGIVDRTIALALAAEGIDVEFQWLPVGRMLSLLELDSLDAYVTPSNTPGQQNPHLHLLQARGVFFYMKASQPDPVPTSLADLAGKRVATVVNSPLTPIFSGAGLVVDEGPLETMFAKLALGRVDFAATADVGGIIAIRRQFPGREREFDFTDLAYATISAGLYVKDRPELLEALETLRSGFRKIKEDGSLEALLIEFFGADTWRRVQVLE